MKKLKLNKETIVRLSTNEKIKLDGGITGYTGCANYTQNETACKTNENNCSGLYAGADYCRTVTL